MVRVKDAANIVAPRGVTEGGDLASQAFLVWQTARRDRHRIKKKQVYGGVSGRIYEGNLTRVILSLWPELSPASREEQLKAVRKDIYEFLRQTGNAVCIDRGGDRHQGIKWWVRDEWSSASDAVVIISRLRPTPAEKRVTPTEAGEDRQPAPITVTQVVFNDGATYEETEDNVAAQTFDAPSGFVEASTRKAEEHQQLLEMIVELLANETDGEPIVAQEVAGALGVNVTTARSALNELVALGKVFTRAETSEERTIRYGGPWRAAHSKLYSTEDPVPTRTQREIVRGIIAELDAPETLRPKGEVEFLAMRALTTTYATLEQIAERIAEPVSKGTLRMVLNRMATSGAIEMKRKRGRSGNMLNHYRKARATPPIAPPAPPTPVQTPDPTPIPAASSDLAGRVKEAVDRLRSENAGRVVELERENAELRREVEELRAALAPLVEFLGDDK